MDEFILMTAEEAERVRYNEPGKGGLNPVEAKNGVFFLGIECLSDPIHGKYLATLDRGPLPELKKVSATGAPE